MTLAKLRRELGVLRGGGEEHHGLPGLGSILGTEDSGPSSNTEPQTFASAFKRIGPHRTSYHSGRKTCTYVGYPRWD